MNKPLSLVLLSILIYFSDITSVFAQDTEQWATFSDHSRIPGYGAKKKGHPEIYQGNKRKKKYFEGWYFKMVSADGTSILSIIPGVSLSVNGNEQHAFIQVIDGKTAKTSYYSFPIEKFSFSKNDFAVKIGENYFSKDKLIINIHDDTSSISGEIRMSEQVELPSGKRLNPGIMGWYRFVPFMQCYHGVVSLTHQLNGSLIKDGKKYIFDGGRGYIEKDWGSSMPSAWIWMQSNNFDEAGNSFMLSVANVPWLGKSFTGFLGFFLHDSTLFRFATYTHAKLQIEKSVSDTVKISIIDRKHNYFIEAFHSITGLLKAPVKGSMDRRIPESIDARLKLTVKDKKGNLIFSGTTNIAGLEMVGDQNILK